MLAALRNRVFFTLDEANAAIRELVAAVDARPLTTNRTLTRRRLFEEQEKPLLMPLPAEPFVIGRWFRYKLAPDYHVSIEGVAYSVSACVRVWSTKPFSKLAKGRKWPAGKLTMIDVPALKEPSRRGSEPSVCANVVTSDWPRHLCRESLPPLP